MKAPALLLSLGTLVLGAAIGPTRADELESGFANPPSEARIRAYWWWLNGNVTKAAITRDLEEMAAKGWGGALLCDAGGAEQDGNARVPHGPTFFTPEWRELYKHALTEADRLGLELSLNIQSGWNLGGPTIRPADAPKKLVWSETRLTGPATVHRRLEEPDHPKELYRDVAVVAYRVRRAREGAPRRPLQSWAEKALHKALYFSAPDTSVLLQEQPSEPGEEDALSGDVRDLTGHLGQDGTLSWDAPEGEWELLRFGSTLNDHSRVSTHSDGGGGFALDPFDAAVFRSYWRDVVEPLIADAGPRAGRSLKYLHTDSWEVEVANWTPTLREEFRRRRGYDLLPFLPVIAGRIVDSRPVSNRFLNDFRRTMGDLAIDNHYRLFRDGAHRHRLLIHPESGGPHAVPVDSLQALGFNDVPMSEFWARSWRHRVGDPNRFFVKQPASAAHTYGRRIVAAEGFTTIGPHWQERLWENLKPSFDRAACEGLNRLVWHAFTASPKEMGLPGQEYFAGTHFNPNSTWWPVSGPFVAYLNRVQHLLQQGLFVADAAYYYGDHVPNFAQLKSSDPAKVLPGYDYDVATEEVVLGRMSVRDGRIVLPDGMSYRVLVLPDRPRISLPVLRKVKRLVTDGATVIGPKPVGATSLSGYPRCDEDVARIADELWGEGKGRGQKATGKGRVIWGRTARDVLRGDGLPPDFERLEPDGSSALDYVHRRDGDTDIYFVANPSDLGQNAACAFRVTGRDPEIWLPDTGEVMKGVPSRERDGRTVVPLGFEPYGSVFVVFRSPAATRVVSARKDGKPVFASGSARGLASGVQIHERAGRLRLGASQTGAYEVTDARGRVARVTVPSLAAPQTLDGGWTLHARTEGLRSPATSPLALERLLSWTELEPPEVKYFSGTLEYSRALELGEDRFGPTRRLWLELGEVREIAQVELNGRDLGILWKPPFRADLTEAARPGENRLVVRVTNFWPNRIIGDLALPDDRRVTRTNIRKFEPDSPLLPSGLIGPVRLVTAAEQVIEFP
jgi:hypothetical protein